MKKIIFFLQLDVHLTIVYCVLSLVDHRWQTGRFLFWEGSYGDVNCFPMSCFSTRKVDKNFSVSK